MSHMYSNQKKKTKTHYKTPCLNVTSCIKIKNGKQIRNTRLCDGNRKKCKSSLQAQKKKKKINNQHQNSLRFFLMEFIVSVSFSTSTTFYLHSSITLYFNDRSMSFC